MIRAAAIAAFAALALAGCGETDKLAIGRVLDQRDQALSAKDFAAYSALIADDYRDARGRTKEDLLAETLTLFDAFDAIEMRSADRAIQLLDENRARAEQTYRLKVVKGGQSREVVQREQVELIRTPVGWRIVSGL